mgnify:CR=1 FL=1
MAIRKIRGNINKKDGSIRGMYVTLPRDEGFVIGQEVEIKPAISAFTTPTTETVVEKKPVTEEELPDVDDLE